jgi:hypothetical protein
VREAVRRVPDHLRKFARAGVSTDLSDTADAGRAAHTARAYGERTPAELDAIALVARIHAVEILTAAGITDPERWLDRPVPDRRGGVSRALRARIGERDGWICQICSKPVDPNHQWQRTGEPERNHDHPTVEHLLPVCVGGTDDPDNLAIAHYGCNVGGRDSGGGIVGRPANWQIIKTVNSARVSATIAAAAREVGAPTPA